MLQGIRILKVLSLESHYDKIISNLRSKELSNLFRYVVLIGWNRILWYSTPIFVSLITFTVYTRYIGDLNVTIAFTGLTLFNGLRGPLQQFPNVVVSWVEAAVSLKRIQTFLKSGKVIQRK